MDSRRRSGLPLATPLALVSIAAAALASAFFPLTGTPGPEAAQILSVVGGPALLLAGAARGAHRHERGFRGDMLAQCALLLGALAIFGLTTTLGRFANTSCAPGRGYLPFLLIAMPTLLLNSALGLWLGRVVGRPKLAVGAAAGFLGIYIGWLLLDWFLEPSFRVLSHLLLLVEGDLVAGRALTPAAVAYRAATLSYVAALTLAGMVRYPRSRRSGLSFHPGPSPALHALAAALLLLGFVVDQQAHDALAPSRAALEERYQLVQRRGPLVVHADPAAVTLHEVEAILAEGDLWLTRLQERLGVAPSDDLHVWLHADPATMGHYTGAEHVHFALPGRGELHISGTEVPHPTLGHELAHLLGRELNPGMLGVPTQLGVLPNAGIIEGLAMAVTPELQVQHGLTLREKAAALRHAGLAPSLDDLFGGYLSFFSFWRQPPGNAYATAGAWVEAIAAAQGVAGLKVLYATGDLAAVFPDDEAYARFVQEQEQALDQLPLPAFATAQMARYYSRASILNATCDPAGLDAARALFGAARSGDFARAEGIAHEADGSELTGDTLRTLARAAGQLHDGERELAYLMARADARDTEDVRERAARDEDAGDALWRHGKKREALVRWERVEQALLSPPHQRAIVAKQLLGTAVVARPDKSEVASAGMELLLDGREGDPTQALARLAAAVARADAGQGAGEPAEVLAFGEYLVARQALQRGHYDEGIELFLRALGRGAALGASFREQSLRALAAGHARRGDLQLAVHAFRTLAAQSQDTATRVFLNDRVERSERMLAARREDAASADRQGDRWLLGVQRATDI